MLKHLPSALVVVALLASPARAQSPKPSPELRDVLAQSWTEVTQKIVTMAEDFPESKYDFRATPDVRTFADVLRHVAFWNQYVAAQVKGQKMDPRQNELPKAQFSTKAQIVAALKQSAADATAALKSQPATPSTKLVGLYNSFTEHSGEHYGQLVVYYRLNGLVPPESRPKTH